MVAEGARDIPIMFSEKCWSRSVQEYGLEPAKMLQSIEFLDLLRKGKLSGAFLDYVNTKLSGKNLILFLSYLPFLGFAAPSLV